MLTVSKRHCEYGIFLGDLKCAVADDQTCHYKSLTQQYNDYALEIIDIRELEDNQKASEVVKEMTSSYENYHEK